MATRHFLLIAVAQHTHSSGHVDTWSQQFRTYKEQSVEIRIEVQNLQDENTGSNQKIRSMEDMMNTNQRKRKKKYLSRNQEFSLSFLQPATERDRLIVLWVNSSFRSFPRNAAWYVPALQGTCSLAVKLQPICFAPLWKGDATAASQQISQIHEECLCGEETAGFGTKCLKEDKVLWVKRNCVGHRKGATNCFKVWLCFKHMIPLVCQLAVASVACFSLPGRLCTKHHVSLHQRGQGWCQGPWERKFGRKWPGAMATRCNHQWQICSASAGRWICRSWDQPWRSRGNTAETKAAIEVFEQNQWNQQCLCSSSVFRRANARWSACGGDQPGRDKHWKAGFATEDSDASTTHQLECHSWLSSTTLPREQQTLWLRSLWHAECSHGACLSYGHPISSAGRSGGAEPRLLRKGPHHTKTVLGSAERKLWVLWPVPAMEWELWRLSDHVYAEVHGGSHWPGWWQGLRDLHHPIVDRFPERAWADLWFCRKGCAFGALEGHGRSSQDLRS